MKQAVILAGGRGKRLRPLTDDVPKPMVLVNGIPFLDYLLQSLDDIGIEEIVLLVGYKNEKIMERYAGAILGGKIRIKYSIGSSDDQTGRRLINAFDLFDEHFLLLYGDNYWPIEISPMLELYKRKKAGVLTTVFSNKQGTGEYGPENNIEVLDDSTVKCYDKTRTHTKLNGVDMGYFIVDKCLLDPSIEGNISFEEDFLPQIVTDRHLVAHVTDRQYYYITNVDSLQNFEHYVNDNQIKSIAREVRYGVF